MAAKEAMQLGEVPVGAAIINYLDGSIVSFSGNRVEADSDPTAHAEILAIRKAAGILNTPRLNMCDIYVTLEPCAMCAKAISLARLRRLYFGAEDPKGGAIYNGPKIFSHSGCNHYPEIYSGISEIISSRLLRDFFKLRR